MQAIWILRRADARLDRRAGGRTPTRLRVVIHPIAGGNPPDCGWVLCVGGCVCGCAPGRRPRRLHVHGRARGRATAGEFVNFEVSGCAPGRRPSRPRTAASTSARPARTPPAPSGTSTLWSAPGRASIGSTLSCCADVSRPVCVCAYSDAIQTTHGRAASTDTIENYIKAII